MYLIYFHAIIPKVQNNSDSELRKMESWEEAHLKKHLSKLLRLTDSSPQFLAELLGSDFTDYDIQSVKCKPTPQDRAYTLYEIAMMKVGGYDKLTVALHNTKQSGALKIFLEGYSSNGKPSPIPSSESSENLNVPAKLLKDQVTPPKQPRYYVPRTLAQKTKLKEEIFTDMLTSSHIFLVKDVKKHELARIAGYASVDTSSNQLDQDQITVRYIILECEEDFDEISQKCTHPVHVIEYKEKSFFWVKSSKGVNIIRAFIDPDGVLYFKEDDLLSRITDTPPPCTFCISDSPGMGKTLLLSNIAKKIEDANKTVVIFIIMQEFVQQIQSIIDCINSAIQALASYASTSPLMLEEMMNDGEKQFDLFLDGYDEIKQDKLDLANNFLNYIRELKNIRVFVTTRPHLKTELEKVVNVISFEILPFNDQNQIEFLSSYWVHQYGAKGGKPLQDFAEKCLAALQTKMTDSEKEIAGIPLQCWMLAEVYATNAVRASKLRNSSKVRLKMHSIFDIYKSLLNMKLGKAMKGNSSKSDRKNLINGNTYEAINLLFPDVIGMFEMFLRGYEKVDKNAICSVGLIENSPSSNAPRFVHRTFAEFLLARFLIKNLSRSCACIEFIFEIFFAKDGIVRKKEKECLPFYNLKYPVIAYFLDRHLKDFLEDKHIDHVLIANQLTFRNIQKDILCLILGSCCCFDLETLFDLIGDIFYSISISDILENINSLKDNYFQNLPHVAITNSRNLTLLTKVFNLINKLFNVDLGFHVCNVQFSVSENCEFPYCSPLHVAAYHGLFNIVSFLIQQYGPAISKLRFVLHACVYESTKNSDSIIEEKISIIETLHAQNPAWLQEEFRGCSPILMRHVHLKILEFLVQLGADINSCTEDGQTILHNSGDSIIFADYLKWALGNGFTKLNERDEDGKTLLVFVVGWLGVVDHEVLQIFYENGADFNARSNDGYSVFFHGLRATLGWSQQIAYIEKILDLGGDVNHVTSSAKENAAHIAIRYSNQLGVDTTALLSILEFLVLKGFKLINSPDAAGIYPLHCAIQDFDADQDLTLRLLEFFHVSGAQFNAMDAEGNSVLFHAIKRNCSVLLIEKIVEYGGDIYHSNARGENIVQIAKSCGNELAIQLLIERFNYVCK